MVRDLATNSENRKMYELGIEVQSICADFREKFPNWWETDETKSVQYTVRTVGKIRLTYSREEIKLTWANTQPKYMYDVYDVVLIERGTKKEIPLIKVASFPESKREKEIPEDVTLSELEFRQKTTSGYTANTVYYHGGGYWRDSTVKASYLILYIDPILGQYSQALNNVLRLAEPAWDREYFSRYEGVVYEQHYYDTSVPYNLLHPRHRYWLNVSNVHYDGMQQIRFPQLQINSYMTTDIKNVLRALYSLESQVYHKKSDGSYEGPNIRKFLWDKYKATSVNLMGINEATDIVSRAARESLAMPSSHSLEEAETDTTWAYVHHDTIKVQHEDLMALHYTYLSMREAESPLFRLINASMVWLPPLDELNEIYTDVEKFVEHYNQENLLNKMEDAHGNEKTSMRIKYVGFDL